MRNENDSAEALHKKHELLTEKIYNNPGMLPDRYVYILTNKCNLRCNFCFQKKHKVSGAMTSDDWINLSKQLPKYARVTMTGGEPLMFKGFKDVFSYVASRNNCNLITNGTLLKNSLSDFILSYPKFRLLSISIDDIGNKIRNIDKGLWGKSEEEIKYFLKRRNKAGSSCALDIKTTILDETADKLFDIHKYCVEDLGADFHVFHFLKGSPIQHADVIYEFKDIYKRTRAETYDKINIIREQFEKIRDYNIKYGKTSFLHPKVGSLAEGGLLDNIDIVNEPYHKKENFQSCRYPWSSNHINVDGMLIPCLAIPMGNVKTQSLDSIINGEKMQRFRKVIKEEGTVNGCNRCGWIKPMVNYQV